MGSSGESDDAGKGRGWTVGGFDRRFTAVLVGGIALIVILGVLPVVAWMLSLGGGGMGSGMMGGGMMGGGMMGGLLGGVMGWVPLVLPVVIVAFVALLVWLAMSDSGEADDGTADPLETLERRYLDDDIDLEEYERRLERLFELDADDAHPELKAVAIRYARGDIDRATLEARIEALDDGDSVEVADADRFLRATFGSAQPSSASIHLEEPREQPDAVQRLRRRYADGELSSAEYEQRLGVLRETDTAER
jgi:uncharacterized membrane protein